MTMRLRSAAITILLASSPCLAASARAEPKDSPVQVAAAAPAPAPAQAGMSEAQTYCQNIASAAADARFARESKALNVLEAKIQQRVAELEAKQAEYRDVLARHDEAMKRAEASLVAIYAQMRPDAAATQLSALDDATAAAVLSQLKPRQASQILNEVTPERAVRLVNAIAGLAPMDKS
jgi:flagellar motility protein MotE (MotC chaperone)